MNFSSSDRWGSGSAYEAYVGRWSRVVARTFIPWLRISPGAGWLDVGCGTGALTAAIRELASPRQITGIDFSLPFIGAARERVRGDDVSFAVANAQALPVASRFDAAVSALALNFFPQPETALAEMARAVRPGGVVAVYVWDYVGGMEMMQYFWDAAVALSPAARDLTESLRFERWQPGPLRDLFEATHLSEVDVREIQVSTLFRNWDDYWEPFLGGQGPAPSYVHSLSQADRAALRDRIREALPFAADGSIPLHARALAVRGVTA